jgi:hypothetical protein
MLEPLISDFDGNTRNNGMDTKKIFRIIIKIIWKIQQTKYVLLPEVIAE